MIGPYTPTLRRTVWYVRGFWLSTKVFPDGGRRRPRRCRLSHETRTIIFIIIDSTVDCPLQKILSGMEPKFPVDVNQLPTPHPFLSKEFRMDKLQGHFPAKYTGPARPECCAHKYRVRTPYFCGLCGVFLCIERGCNYRFHFNSNYMDETVGVRKLNPKVYL